LLFVYTKENGFYDLYCENLTEIFEVAFQNS